MKRLVGLDILRFFAIIMVALFHFYYRWTPSMSSEFIAVFPNYEFSNTFFSNMAIWELIFFL